MDKNISSLQINDVGMAPHSTVWFTISVGRFQHMSYAHHLSVRRRTNVLSSPSLSRIDTLPQIESAPVLNLQRKAVLITSVDLLNEYTFLSR
jgi:hypothetical protein